MALGVMRGAVRATVWMALVRVARWFVLAAAGLVGIASGTGMAYGLVYAMENPIPFPDLPSWAWQGLAAIAVPAAIMLSLLWLADQRAKLRDARMDISVHAEALTDHGRRIRGLESVRDVMAADMARREEEARRAHDEFTRSIDVRLAALADAQIQHREHVEAILVQVRQLLQETREDSREIREALTGHIADENTYRRERGAQDEHLIVVANNMLKATRAATEALKVAGGAK